MSAYRKNIQRGQGLLELALVIPMLILLLVGILDLGRVTYYYSATINSAREAARYGIIFPADTTGIAQTARDAVFGIMPTTILVNCWDEDSILVTVESSFIPATPMISFFLGGESITLHSETIMQVEGKTCDY